MNNINQIIGGLFPPRQPKEDEYINEADGLIYCAKCRTPRQCVIHHGERIITPLVMCDCQRITEEREEAAFQKRQAEFRIERMKAEISKAREYVAQWSEMKKSCIGLLLWGDVGTGKTFIAACIANALIEQGVPVLMTNFSKILNQLSSMFNEDRNKYIESMNGYSLLIIDDLGIERNSEFALEQVFNVIDSRYRSKKPLIVTTNLTLDELKHPKSLAHARIYDRILERCVPLKVNNQNIRKLNAAETLSAARKLLTAEKEDL